MRAARRQTRMAILTTGTACDKVAGCQSATPVRKTASCARSIPAEGRAGAICIAPHKVSVSSICGGLAAFATNRTSGAPDRGGPLNRPDPVGDGPRPASNQPGSSRFLQRGVFAMRRGNLGARHYEIPATIRTAFWWNRHGFRGKAAIPKALGRLWGGAGLYILTRSGGKLSVDHRNLDVYAYIYNAGGHWDATVMNMCERLLRPGDVYYDIGANTGIFSIDAASAIRDLRVYCFEPQPMLANNIKRSIDANQFDRVSCIECLLGREDGEQSLYLTSHSIHASIVPREAKFEKIDVRMRSLDSLVRSRQIEPPDIIKMDVEGAEIEVLTGASEVLAACEPSIIFEADENLLRVNKKVDDVISCINKIAPYQILRINEEGGLSSVDGKPSYGNYLALASKHVVRLLDRKDGR